MRPVRRLCAALLALRAVAGPAAASADRDAPGTARLTVPTPAVIEGCLTAAARVHRLPAPVLVILLNVEGGRLGRVSGNANGAVDIGPMQVNEIWLPALARHWRAPAAAAFLALRDNFCANVEAGAFILRRSLDEAAGDFWTGVGFYHSHSPGHRAAYLRKVLGQALRLEAAMDRPAPAPAGR